MTPPSLPTFRVLADLEAISREAATWVAGAARDAASQRGVCTIALSGGSTPEQLYRLLASDEYRRALPWDAITWYWSDERCVPPGDPESNYRLAFDSLLGPVKVPAERVHRIAGETRPATRAASDYEETLRRTLIDGTLDIVLLGVGPDGHTASLFPGSPALDEHERWVVATEAPAPARIRERITMTYPLLDRARNVLVLASGEGKRDVVRTTMRDPAATAGRYPATRLTPPNPVTWLVDKAAAGEV